MFAPAALQTALDFTHIRGLKMSVDIDTQAVLEIFREEIREGLKPVLRLAALREKVLLTADEVEALYSIKSGSLKTMRAYGKGPKCRGHDRRTYYTHADILDYLRPKGKN